MSRGIWSQQLLFLLPLHIPTVVASVNSLKNTAFGGDGLNCPALDQSRWGII